MSRAPHDPLAAGRAMKLAGSALLHTAAALLLFAAPDLVGFGGTSASWTARLTAAAMLVSPGLLVAGRTEPAGWTALGFGLWAMLAPLFFNYAADPAAFWSHFLAGAVATFCASTALDTGEGHVVKTTDPPGGRRAPRFGAVEQRRVS